MMKSQVELYSGFTSIEQICLAYDRVSTRYAGAGIVAGIKEKAINNLRTMRSENKTLALGTSVVVGFHEESLTGKKEFSAGGDIFFLEGSTDALTFSAGLTYSEYNGGPPPKHSIKFGLDTTYTNSTIVDGVSQNAVFTAAMTFSLEQ